MGHPWTIFNLTASDLFVIALMIVVFVLAVALPHPDDGAKEDRK